MENVYCKNKLCDYKTIYPIRVYPIDEPIGVCPKCGFKTIYLINEINEKYIDKLIEALRDTIKGKDFLLVKPYKNA